MSRSGSWMLEGVRRPLKTLGNHAILTGTQVEMSRAAAPLLNKTFKTSGEANRRLSFRETQSL